MPSGYVPGLPKPVPAAGSPQWGTVEQVGTSGSWNVSTFTLATPAENEFWVIARSTASSAYHYNAGTSQNVTQNSEGIVGVHNGTNGWTSGFLDTMKPINGQTWDTTVNTNVYGSYHSTSSLRFSYTEGFQIRPYLGKYDQHTAAANNVTHTPYTNTGPYPGGVCVAMACHEAGGASGMTGISAGSIAAGWQGGTYGGVLTSIAWYVLSTTEIETPPPVTFTTVYTPNCWISASGYIR